MLNGLRIFSVSHFIPYGYCYLWKPTLIGLHVASDVIIAFSCFSIVLLLIYFLQQYPNILRRRMFWLFSAFIIISGTTHLMATWTLWHPNYWLSGLLKAITAGVSLYMAREMVHGIPEALALKSNLTQLEAANQALVQEIEKDQQLESAQDVTERKFTQEALEQAKNQLEIQVEERTQELQQALAERKEVISQLQNEIEQRQQVEGALKQREHQYRSVVENVKEVIFQTDANGFWTFLNPAWSEITGFAIASSLGTLFLDYVHPDDRQRNLEYFQPLIEGKKEYCRYEVRYLTASGGYRWIDVFAQLTFHTDWTIIGTCGTLYDITERHLSEAALFKRERYFATLVEVQRRLLAFQKNSQYELLDRTPYAEILELLGQVSGASRVYVFETHWDSTGAPALTQQSEWCSPGIHPEINNPISQNLCYDNFFPRWTQVLSHDQIISGTVAEFPEAERIVLELQGILSILILPLIVNGKFFGFIGFDNCIEARSWDASEVDLLRAAAAAIALWYESFFAQKALRQSEVTNRALLEAIPDALLQISRDGTYLDVVPAKNLASLIPTRELLGKKVSEVLPFEWARRIMGDVEAALQTGKAQVSEGPFQINDEQYHYEMRTVFYSEDEVLTIVRDISDAVAAATQRKQAEAARRKSEARLRKQHRALSDLAQCPSIYDGSLNAALQAITRTVTRTLDAERCSVWFYNENGSFIHCVDLYELSFHRHSSGYQLQAAEYPSYFKALETERVIAASDAHTDPLTYEFSASYLTPLGITSLLDVPIHVGGMTVGVLRTEHTRSQRQWALEEQNFVCTIAYLASLAMEASHRLITEKALRKSEERFRSLVTHIPGVVYRCTYDANRTMEFISDFIAEMSGYPAADFLHSQVRTFASLMKPQDLARVEQTLADCLAQRLPYVLEYRIIRADGSVRWVYEKGQGVFNAQGSLLWLDGVIFDITEYRQTQEELRQSEEQFRQLTENIREVFFLSTPDFSQILYISPTYEEVWGRPIKSLYEQPRSWMDSVHPQDRTRVASALARQRQGAQALEEEYRIVRPDNSVRWVWVRAFQVLNKAGLLERIAGIAEDITERKRAEVEILNALAKEKELSDLKSRFVSMTSHEFRTPLTTIMSTAELLEYYNWTKQEEVEQLHLIQDSVKHMLQLLEDMLFIGIADAGQLPFNPTPIALNEFCRELVAEMQRGLSLSAIATGTRHHLIFLCPDQIVFACMDQKLLRQLLSNLLLNAIKYSPAGGTVQLKLACQGDQAIFQIQDQGIGILREDLPRLFEFFHRGKNVGAIAGTGLGLAIVKKCVDLHHGHIALHSEVGVGTQITVSLPLNHPHLPECQCVKELPPKIPDP